jgi:hypothetical protein
MIAGVADTSPAFSHCQGLYSQSRHRAAQDRSFADQPYRSRLPDRKRTVCQHQPLMI